MEKRPRPSQLSYSSAFSGFFERNARGVPARQDIPKDIAYNSVLIDTCYVGYFSDPYHPIRIIDNYKHKDCYMIVQTSEGAFFVYFMLPELNNNVVDVSGKIIGEPIHFAQYGSDAIQRVESEADRLYQQFGVDPLIKSEMHVKKRRLGW